MQSDYTIILLTCSISTTPYGERVIAKGLRRDRVKFSDMKKIWKKKKKKNTLITVVRVKAKLERFNEYGCLLIIARHEGGDDKI